MNWNDVYEPFKLICNVALAIGSVGYFLSSIRSHIKGEYAKAASEAGISIMLTLSGFAV